VINVYYIYKQFNKLCTQISFKEKNMYLIFEQYMQEYLNCMQLSVIQGIMLKSQHKYKKTWSTTAKVADHSLTTMHMVTLHHLKVVIYSIIVLIHVLCGTGMNILLWFRNMAVSTEQQKHLLLWCKLPFVYEYIMKCNKKKI
jgi:hypothetical protein